MTTPHLEDAEMNRLFTELSKLEAEQIAYAEAGFRYHPRMPFVWRDMDAFKRQINNRCAALGSAPFFNIK
jgi:hypothetical protein